MNSQGLKNLFVKIAQTIQGAAAKGGAGGSGGGGGGGGAASALLGGILVLGGGATGAYYSLVTINPGHKGIVYSRFGGLIENWTLNEGLNFIVPWFHRPVVYDVRTHVSVTDTVSGTKDLQMVSINLRVLLRVDQNELPHIYRVLGKDYENRVIPSLAHEVTKAVVAQYNASELLTKRQIVSKQISEQLVKRAAEFKIVFEDVALTHVGFSKEFLHAVEAKQVAQQDSERAKYIVERAIQEKRAIIIKAAGEAKSAELIGNAIQNNPAFVQLRRIEASKEIANTIIASGNKVYLSADSLMINSLGDSYRDALEESSANSTSAAPAAAKKAGVLCDVVQSRNAENNALCSQTSVAYEITRRASSALSRPSVFYRSAWCLMAITIAQPQVVIEGDVVVIGSGCAGLAAAWHLNRSSIDVHLFEADSRAGGHANTVHVDGVDVDTGFMVYNAVNYPHLCSFFEAINLGGENTSMGFSVSMQDGKFEWCSDSLSGLLATPSNIINPRFYLMMSEIFRFNKEALAVLRLPDDHAIKSKTVGDFLKDRKFSDSFRDNYLVPMTAAIWSATSKDMMGFPIITLFTFLNNHLLLQVKDNLNWRTPARRSQQYVSVIASELGERLKVDHAVQSIQRTSDPATGNTSVRIIDSHGREHIFKRVVFACHPDQILKILGKDATAKEVEVLSAFRYADNDTYVHTDESLMPRARSAWTSWNYIGRSGKSSGDGKEEVSSQPVFVTYWLNKLQNLKHPRNIFVSLNPDRSPKSGSILKKLNYSHPQYSVESVAAQKVVASMQGQAGTYYCGAWMGYGFHEDGFRSGLEVAMAASGSAVPWLAKIQRQLKQLQLSPCVSPVPAVLIPGEPEATSVIPRSGGIGSAIVNFFAAILAPARRSLEGFCQGQVLAFLSSGLRKGKLSILLADGRELCFSGGIPTAEKDRVVIRVLKPWFFVRLALEADIGMARSYIAKEWDVVESTIAVSGDGLTRFLELLIDNIPKGSSSQGGFDVNRLATAWVGTVVNWLWYRFSLDNSISNSRSNIHAHYDLSNDLFETFLDKKHMMYSSAIFETKALSGPDRSNEVAFSGSLESAQTRKIDYLLSRLEPLDSSHTLLDIGFGWGGICIRAAEKYGCRVTGITLSIEQKALAEARVREKGLQHLMTFELVDYRVFAERCRKTGVSFDRIISCEMIEAVGHNHLGSFFRAVEYMLGKDGIFVMQAITMPDARYPVYVKSADFANTIIFPGGCCPSLSALLNAMAKESSLHLESATNTNLHYAETLRRWRERFNAARECVLQLGFDDAFTRLWNFYLCYCEAGFQKQVINLQILTFSRPSNRNMTLQNSLFSTRD